MVYKRDYKAEYANYDGTEVVKKKRAQRNKARRMLEREGVVSKGGKTVRSNLKAKSASANRSFPRKSDGSIK